MKTNLLLAACLIQALLACTVYAQQWQGDTTSTGAVWHQGLVGIGTSNPTYPLHVTGDVYSSSIIRAQNYFNAMGGTGSGLYISGGENVIRNNSDLHLQTNNTTRLAVTYGGNVGVGISEPPQKLSVYGSGDLHASVVSTSSNGDAGVILGNVSSGGNSWAVRRGNTGHFQIVRSTGLFPLGTLSYAFVIDLANRVGIGTAAPASLFSVGPTSNFQVNESGHVRLGGSTDAFGTVALNFNNSTTFSSTSPVFGIKGAALNGGANGSGNVTGIHVEGRSNYAGAVAGVTGGVFKVDAVNASTVMSSGYAVVAGAPSMTSGATIGNAYGLYIQNQKPPGVTKGYGVYQVGTSDINFLAGRLGIGTPTPTASLDVAGGARLDSLMLDGILRFPDGTTMTTAATGNGDTTWTKNGVAISYEGNVSIGAAGAGHLLAVNGNVQAREVIVTTDAASWPDFVFEDDYTLMPLEELARFITEHGHLPAIPAAAEVAEEGVHVGRMQALLLQKIEELTQYALQQHERLRDLEAVKAENERLRERLDALETLLLDR